MAKCKSCGAFIVWIDTPTGKHMPCDNTIVPYWKDRKGKESVVTDEGTVVRCSTEWHPRQPDGAGRIPHWATCPFASQHKRKR